MSSFSIRRPFNSRNMSYTAVQPAQQPQATKVPQAHPASSHSPLHAAAYGTTLVYFMHRLLDFREAELHSLASICGISRDELNQRKLPNDHDLSPLRIIAPLSSQQQEQICSRAVLVKVCANSQTLLPVLAPVSQVQIDSSECFCRDCLRFGAMAARWKS